ncbi:MAG: AAA family ATPase [Clostridia bacterium]|nr:AAA family ATPase [Clostridia bacterium]
MNLKEIQLYGFKSFSDKICLQFNNPITGIVGPNGCGKSNVVDAIKWVLGEQSARGLRGKTMQDLIFSGTEQKKSMSYCEVTMILDNKSRVFPIEMDEITIARRLYRDNESEYLINKNSVRLKDMLDLLRDAGLGKEGYAVVGQGRMDAILNARPEDRRAIFEESLGVSKFRVRKAEAERKMEKTRDNIVRLNDILSELERQIGPLKRQSADAKKFLEYQEQLKYHEINNYIYSYDNASVNKKRIKDKITQLTLKHNEASQKYDVAFAKHEKLFKEIYDMDTVIKSLHTTQLDLSVRIANSKGEVRVLDEKIKNISSNSAELQKEIEQSNSLLQSNTIGLENTIKLQNNLKSEEQSLTTRLNELGQQYLTCLDELTVWQQKMDKMNKQVLEIYNSLSKERSNLSSYTSQKNALENRLSNIDKDCAEIDQRLDDLTNKQSNEILTLITSNFEKQTTKQMAERIDGYLDNVNVCLNKIRLEPRIKQQVKQLVDIVSDKSKQELAVSNQKAENWQQNIILMSALSEKLSKFSALQQSNFDQKDKLLRERESVCDKLKSVNQLVAISSQEEQRLREVKQNAEEQVSQSQKLYNQAKSKKDKLQEDVNSCKLKVAGLGMNIQSCESKITGYKQTNTRVAFEITQKQRQIETNNILLKNLYEQLSSNTGTEAENQQLKDIDERINHADSLKKDLQMQCAEADHQRTFYNAEMQQISDDKNRQEFSLERIDDDINDIKERIEQQYGLTYSSAMRYKDNNYDIESSKEQINKFFALINKLGYVNVNAVQDYEQTQARYDDIKVQIADMRQAEQDLLKLLKDLTHEMITRFNQGFEIINVNFGNVFKELFAGGYARMTIERDENKDELDYGIEIEAQPPGKKLRNISLLSGGERTLTATAILFAILKLRPMPFCVLDEIEAALDDANAERISTFLRKFATQTQFIVITHKKPTMESCDVLYGVTMEEKGVSKVVSVELTDAMSMPA